jgi:hypothetical protein
MLTVNTHKTNILPFYDCRGLSTDTKPTNVPNGSTFCEIDTGKGYLFDAAGGTWEEIPEGSTITIDPARGVSF